MGEVERRAHPRYRMWLPAQLVLDEAGTDGGGAVLGVIHDVSQKGALAVVAEDVSQAKGAVLHLEVPPEGGRRWQIRAEVLRCVANELDPHGLWPFQVAIEFVDAAPELEETLRGQPWMLQGIHDHSEQTNP